MTLDPAAEVTTWRQATPGGLEPINNSGRASKLTPEAVDTALLVLAMSSTAQEAADRLAERFPQWAVSAGTLNRWRRDMYPNRYRHLTHVHQAELEQIVVANMRGILHAASAGTMEAIDLERRRIAAGDVKDAAASARNLATVAGINADKMLTLQGRPTAIMETRSADDVLRALEQRGYVDSTVVEDG